MRFRLYSSIATALTKLLKPNRSDWKKGKPATEKNTLWFHAASSGELEVLIPVIEAAVKAGRKTCVSIFSESAESWLKRLPSPLLYSGFSPPEDQWSAAFQHYGVSEVITSKYEAWPGLWRAASLGQIRITVICAQMRSSLLWAKRLLTLMGTELPKLRFYVLDENAVSELKSNFPAAECIVSADPRWVRVITRAENAHAHERLQQWREKYAHAPKPYWVIGSAWKEDLSFLSRAIQNYPGTVWVVPHSLKPAPSPALFAPFPNCVLVDEMGMLVELYSIADRVWVGGGFGEGIHSTLEPSVYSIPVACGPNHVEDFFETRELREKGVLTVCATEGEVELWLTGTESASHSGSFSLKSKLEMIQQMLASIIVGGIDGVIDSTTGSVR